MKIRTQLILAFLLLAILPLTGIVFYSFLSSGTAVTQAVKTESLALNAQMEERLEEIKEDLENRVNNLWDLPFDSLKEDSPEGRRRLYGRVAVAIGEAGSMVDSLNFIPIPEVPTVETPRHPEAPSLLAPRTFPGQPDVPRGDDSESFALERIWQSETTTFVDSQSESLFIDYDTVIESVERATRVHEVLEVDVETLREPIVASRMLSRLQSVIEALAEEIAIAESAGHEEEARRIEESQRRVESQILGLEAKIQARQARENQLQARQEHQREKRKMEEMRRKTRRVLGQPLGVRIVSGGQTIGEVQATIVVKELIHRVLIATPHDRGELPFAIDGEGELFVVGEAEREILEELRLVRDPQTGEVISEADNPDWVVTSHPDPDRALTFGIARPIGDALAAIKRTAKTNLLYGLGLIGLALLGILPLTRRITRGLETVTMGAERIARGDLSTRVPITSRNEIGQLAVVFNRMARDLSEQQERLVEEEGRRKEQDLERRLLEADYERTTLELEEAREFQLSLLPKRVPEHETFEVAVDMRTATEVGGDYYDFHLEKDILTVAVGDATGHGAKAGTMVAVIKSLFSASSMTAASPSVFLTQAAAAVKRMDLERMAMALLIARLEGRRLTVSSAGMPPVLVHRVASGKVEELELAGMPLGGLAFDYQERVVELEPGDTLLFLSDGFPELQNSDGDLLGYPEVLDSFAAAAAHAPAEIIAELADKASAWTGSTAPQDDLTFVVVRIR